jgi:hypothetical protein
MIILLPNPWKVIMKEGESQMIGTKEKNKKKWHSFEKLEYFKYRGILKK